MSLSHQSSLIQNGYTISKDFVEQSLVGLLRNHGEKKLSSENDFTLTPSAFLRSDELSNIVFSGETLRVLTDLSKDYKYFLPNFTIRKALFINWHTDDEFVASDDDLLPGVLQCNVYLQNNSSEYGGGIDVAHGTSRITVSHKKEMIKNEDFCYETVPTEAGDLLIFDYRAIHRSTHPSVRTRDMSRLAIQWSVCKSFDHACHFVNYFLRRQKTRLHVSDFTDKRALNYFNDLDNVEFPHHFPEKIVDFVRNNNIIIPSVRDILDRVAA